MQRCWNTLYLHLSDFLFYVFIKIKKYERNTIPCLFALRKCLCCWSLVSSLFSFCEFTWERRDPCRFDNLFTTAVDGRLVCLRSKNLRGLEWKALRFGKLEIRLPFTFDEFASKRRVLLKTGKVNSCQWLQWKTSFWFLIIIYFYSFPQFSFRFWYFYFSFNKRSWEKTIVSRFVFT